MKRVLPDVETENEFLANVPAVVGLESSDTSNYPRETLYGPPLKSIKPKFTQIQADKAKVRILPDDTIIWTRNQSRLIEYMARYQTEYKTQNTTASKNNKNFAPYADTHIQTLRRFARKIGVGKTEIYGLRRFPPFWIAINERKTEILGVERYHQVADSIFKAAMEGSHADRRLYLETFRNLDSKANPQNSQSFEAKLLNQFYEQGRLRISLRKKKQRKKKAILLRKSKSNADKYV